MNSHERRLNQLAAEAQATGDADEFFEVLVSTVQDDLRQQLVGKFSRAISPEEVHDFMQRTFVAAFMALTRGQWRGESVVGWLWAIAKNEVLKELRERKRRRETTLPDGTTLEWFDARPVGTVRSPGRHESKRSRATERRLPSGPATYEADLDVREARDSFHAQLGPVDREVVRLHQDGRSDSDIAEALGLPSRYSVASRLDRLYELARPLYERE